MKPKTKYSTSKIPPAKLNNTTGKPLVKSFKLKRAQQKTKDICHVYYMRLRSGLTIKKEAYCYKRETTRRCLLNTGGKHKEKHQKLSDYLQPTLQSSVFEITTIQEPSIRESCTSLSTYNDQSVSFVLEDGSYVINVEDLGKNQEKDKVLLRYYESPYSSESGDVVDGKMLMVNLSPTDDKDIWLHANNEEHSVELQKCETPLPDQALFVLHKESTEYVSFECKNNRGTYIGVKDNHLALIEGKNMSNENIMFKLS
uniref:interleukin-33 n=1 Tax=Jaculus jaculus TaxID=51337 RepID=UPI001E1B07D9|nr:interleukin-33 [Jaculus jaculus]XP_044995052.1 interleukin-33 [Jaculus jaculus]